MAMDTVVKKEMFSAELENLPLIQEYIDRPLLQAGWPEMELYAIEVVVEELFVNVVNYAYRGKKGPVWIWIRMAEMGQYAEITFVDHGVPFNPLARETTHEASLHDKTEVGGWGLFIVNQSMDRFTYEYKDDCNIVTIGKKISLPDGMGKKSAI